MCYQILIKISSLYEIDVRRSWKWGKWEIAVTSRLLPTVVLLDSKTQLWLYGVMLQIYSPSASNSRNMKNIFPKKKQE